MGSLAQKLFHGHVAMHVPSSSELFWWHEHLERDLQQERSKIRLCVGVGIGLDLIVLAIALLFARIFEGASAAVDAEEAYEDAAAMAGSLCAMMLIVAILTKPAGRAERAREVFQRGLHGNCQNRLEGIAISLVMIIALYGSYALVEGCKRWWMQHRLAAVDRYEVARVMAAISAAPMGLSWKWLLKNGQSEKSLRGPVAALLLNGGIKILDNGNTLVQQSRSMRTLLHRHPLADVFQPGT